MQRSPMNRTALAGCPARSILGVIAMIALALAGGCAKFSAPEMSGAAPQMMEAMDKSARSMGGEYLDEGVDEVAMADGEEAPFGGGETIDAAAQRKLIRTADLTLVNLANAQETIKKVEIIAREAGGFVGNTSLSRYGDGTQYGSVTVRVPSARFEKVLGELRELGRVEEINSSVRDVTAEYVDIEARIRNAKREEQEILKLFDRGGKLADIIQVATKLSEVRERIERFEGSMRVLREQVDLSTITVSIHEKAIPQVMQPEGYNLDFHLRSAARALVSIFWGLVTFLIYLMVPGFIFWLPIVVIIWLVVRRRRATSEAAGQEGEEQGE